MSAHQWAAFFIAAIGMNLLPGSDTFYVIARTVSQGSRAGLASAAGIFSGCLFHITAAAIGLSLLVLKFAFLYQTIKYAGAAYLIYLGISLLRERSASYDLPKPPPAAVWKVYRQGALTNALNPKVALFFLAFLPQFVDRHNPHAGLQIAMLGAIFAAMGSTYLAILSLAVGKMSGLVQSPRFAAVQRRVSATVLIALGVRVAVPEIPS